MTDLARFCTRCGAALAPGSAFCAQCGAAVVAPGTPNPGPTVARSGDDPAGATLLAGLLWIGVAVIGAYLAYLQWTGAQDLLRVGVARLADGTATSSLQMYAAGNAAVAAVTLLFGAVLFASPTRGRLDASAAWAVLSVLGGVLQIASHETHWTIFAGTVGAAVAGVLSLVARNRYPARPAT